MRVQESVLLPVAIDEAWGFLLRWEAQAGWMQDADSIEVIGSRRTGVGTTVAVRTRVLNVPLFTERLEVTVWEPPRRLVMAHRSFVRGVGTWVLETVERGCRFTWTEDLWLPVPVLGERALRVYAPVMRRLMRGSLRNLQRSVGNGGRSSAGA